MRRTPSSFTSEERTYVRAGTYADLREGVRIGKPVGWRLRGHAGWLAPVVGPREIGAANAAKTTRAFPRSREPASVTPAVYGPSVRDALLRDLDPLQHDAVTSDAAPLAIIAPAGSGKTRVLTRRIAYGLVRRIVARHVLAVTFTRKAAGELVSRNRSARGRRPHHRRARSTRSPRAAAAPCHRAQSREAPHVLDRKARLLDRSWAEAGRPPWRWQMSRPNRVGESAPHLADGYEAAADAAGRRTPRGACGTSQCTGRTNGKAPPAPDRLHDVLGPAAQMRSRGTRSFAAGQRWRFRHLSVDEFQDAPVATTTPAAWLGDSNELTWWRPGPGDLGFTGADAAPLSLRQTFREARRSRSPELPEHTGRRGARRGRARAERVVESPRARRRTTPRARRRSGATTTTTPRRVRSPRRARRPTRTECRGTAWPSVPHHAQSSRFERRSPSAVCPSGSARGSASRPDRSVATLLDHLRTRSGSFRPPVGALPSPISPPTTR